MGQNLQTTLDDLLRKQKEGTIDAATAAAVICELGKQNSAQDIESWLRDVLHNSKPFLPGEDSNQSAQTVAIHAWATIGSIDALIGDAFKLAEAYDPDGYEKWAHTIHPPFQYVLVNNDRFSEQHLMNVRTRCRSYQASWQANPGLYPESFCTAILNLEKSIDGVEVQILRRKLTAGADSDNKSDLVFAASPVADRNEALAAEIRLSLSALKAALKNSHREITARAAAEGSLNSGGTIRKLIRSLIEHMERAAETLLSAHARAGSDRPDEVATRLRSDLKPIADAFLDSCRRTLKSVERAFDTIMPDVDTFFDSLEDRAIVALMNYPKSTERIIAGLSPGKLPVGWERVQRALEKAQGQLSRAKDEEDWQTVGLLCREVLISTGQIVYDPERHPPIDGVVPSKTDVKRQLDSFFAAELPGDSNEPVRRHARSALDVANSLVHKRTATFRLGSLCFEATSTVVNLVAIVSVNR